MANVTDDPVSLARKRRALANDLQPTVQTLFQLVDERVEMRLRKAGVQPAGLDGDQLAGPIKLAALEWAIKGALLADGTAQPIVAGETDFLAVPFACRIRRWKLLTKQPGNLSLSLSSAAGANGVPTWLALGTMANGGTVRNSSTTLDGWTKDDRGWVLLRNDTDLQVIVTGNDVVTHATAILYLERLPEADLPTA